MSVHFFDIIIYCPLEEEFQEIYDILGYEEDLTEELGFLCLRSAISGLKILIVAGDEMGVQAAQSTAAQIDKICKFKMYICLGIAGAISDDVSLGDVCYTGKVFDITVNQKVTDESTELSPAPYRTTHEFTTKLSYFKKHPDLKKAREELRDICLNEIKNAKEKNSNLEGVSINASSHSGAIFTGPVSAGAKIKKKIKSLDRKALAVETEVGGVFSLFERDPNIVVMTIRGISDGADENKNKLEEETEGDIRKIAVRNATHFLKSNLEHNTFFRDLFSVDDTGDLLDGIETKKVKNVDILDIAIKRSAKRFSQDLKEKSLEFKNKSENYWVPAPRIKVRSFLEDNTKTYDVEDLLSEERHLALEIPFGYPDKGAPSLFGMQLISTEVFGKTTLPIYTDISTFAPPRSIGYFCPDFTNMEIEELIKRDDVILVFILDDLPIGSLTKINHLISELTLSNNILSVSFLTFQKVQEHGLESIPDFFCKGEVEGVSFASITKFIRREFEMEYIEAESMAFKLSKTFEEFDLPAHPNYFAGIPKDFLTKLLDANRRSELLELAVAGFLTFAVAGDNSEVRLSRTTRKNFLMKLLGHMELDGQQFDSSAVTELARATLVKFDFDVDPQSFVDKFFEFGLLYENAGQVEFALPFIKSYLLAEMLNKDLSIAKKYFNIHAEEFDFTTFVLYCEMNGGNGIFDSVLNEITTDVLNFSNIIELSYDENGVDRHALLDVKIGPRVLKNTRAILGAKDSVTEQAEKVLMCTDEAEKKQELLDLTAATKLSVHHHHSEQTKKTPYSGRHKILRDLRLAQTIMGSGSEHLEASKKQEIGKQILLLSSLILNDWYRGIDGVDYNELRGKVFNDVYKLFSERSSDVDSVEVEKFVNIFVDMMELEVFMGVVPALMSTINELATHPVLMKTLQQISCTDQVTELFRALWMITIDVKKGAKPFKNSVGRMPQRAFTRFSIANFIINQAYWYASTEDERVELLTLAEYLMKPIGITMK